ncbi:MAG: cytoskeleton protein RodZ [Chloroflexota bacterium]|nr:cytoskeleton protein RodZ [Chloroflexota bacterium]
MKPTVGQQLQRAREQAGISLDDAAHETHIRAHYLQNLEDDHPELLHSAAQARGFLRLYAEYLHLSYPDLLALWDTPAEEPAAEAADQAPDAEKSSPALSLGWIKKRISKKEEQPADASAQLPEESEPQPEPESGSQVSQQGDEIVPEEAPEVESEERTEEESEAEPASRSIFAGAEAHAEESTDVENTADQQPQPETPLEAETEESSTGVKGVLRKAVAALSALGRTISRLLPRRGNSDADGESAPSAAARSKAPQNSQDIFDQIGGLLQTRRKAMELSLTDIENFTNLKRSFLIALEEGRFNELPSTVQGRGMLNNYAQFLGMEETAVMDLFSQALQLQREERMRPQRKPEQPAVSVKVNVPERWRKIINPDLIIGSILIVGLFAFIIWGASQVFSNTGGGPTEAPSISEMLQTTPSESPEPDLAATERAESTAGVEEATPLPGVNVVEATPTIVATVNTAPLQVVIITHDRAYLRVTVDGVETFNGRLAPDNVYSYSGNVSIDLLTGNAAALEVYFNQEYVGSLGGVGEVVNIDFNADGLVAPGAAATPIPTQELPTPEALPTEVVPTETTSVETAPTE